MRNLKCVGMCECVRGSRGPGEGEFAQRRGRGEHAVLRLLVGLAGVGALPGRSRWMCALALCQCLHLHQNRSNVVGDRVLHLPAESCGLGIRSLREHSPFPPSHSRTRKRRLAVRKSWQSSVSTITHITRRGVQGQGDGKGFRNLHKEGQAAENADEFDNAQGLDQPNYSHIRVKTHSARGLRITRLENQEIQSDSRRRVTQFVVVGVCVVSKALCATTEMTRKRRALGVSQACPLEYAST